MTPQPLPVMLGLTARVATIGLAVFVVTTALLMLLTPDAAGRWQNWASLVVLTAAAALSVTGMPDRLPASTAWIVASLCVIASLQSFWEEADGAGSYAPWYLRAITEVCAWLILRGRPVQAWVAGVVASGLLVATDTGELGTAVRQFANLIAVLILVYALGRAARAIAALRDEQRIRVERDEAREVAVATRRTELGVIRSRADPLLRRIASGRALSASVRHEAESLEAELRDLLRGRRLAEEPLVAVVRDARTRGLDVVLLDDRNLPLTDAEGESVRQWAAARLGSSHGPGVTIRLSDSGVTLVSGDAREPDELALT